MKTPEQKDKKGLPIEKYVSRPAIVHAVRLTTENFSEVKEWSGGHHYSTPPMRQITGLKFQPSIYQDFALFGDWVVQSADGSFRGVPEVYWNGYIPFSDSQASKTEMSGEVKSAESLLSENGFHYSDDEVECRICADLMREYARQERDRALNWAAKNVSMQVLQVLGSKRYSIDRDSIISGKTRRPISQSDPITANSPQKKVI